jgi:hypothetical protein
MTGLPIVETDHKEDHILLQELCLLVTGTRLKQYVPEDLTARAENYLRQNPNSWQHVEELLKLVQEVIASKEHAEYRFLWTVNADALDRLEDYVVNFFGEE